MKLGGGRSVIRYLAQSADLVTKRTNFNTNGMDRLEEIDGDRGRGEEKREEEEEEEEEEGKKR